MTFPIHMESHKIQWFQWLFPIWWENHNPFHGSKATNQFSIYVPYMFHIFSIYFPYMFHICSIYVPYMFRICSVYVPYMFRICSLSMPKSPSDPMSHTRWKKSVAAYSAHTAMVPAASSGMEPGACFDHGDSMGFLYDFHGVFLLGFNHQQQGF